MWVWRALLVSLGLGLGTCVTYHDLDSMGPVVFTNIIYRHGDRNPLSFYPTDPYQNMRFWPGGLGKITNQGKAREYAVGKWLKAHYQDLLSEHYDDSEVYIQSTDTERTLMSAEANSAGMFPPTGPEIWSDLNWQPVPIHTTPTNLDKILYMQAPCKRYDRLFNETLKTGEGKRWHDQAKWILKYLTKNTGQEVDDLVTITYVYSEILIEDLRNFTLPQWVHKIYPEPLKSVTARAFRLPTLTNELKRLKSGPLVKDMISHFTAKRQGDFTPSKMWIYSAHKSTMMNLMNTLGVYEDRIPPFASVLMLEMRGVPGTHNYTVNILLRNDTTVDPYVLKLPRCSQACPLDKFIELTKHVVPDDWDAECNASGNDDLDLKEGDPADDDVPTRPGSVGVVYSKFID